MSITSEPELWSRISLLWSNPKTFDLKCGKRVFCVNPYPEDPCFGLCQTIERFRCSHEAVDVVATAARRRLDAVLSKATAEGRYFGGYLFALDDNGAASRAELARRLEKAAKK